MPSNQLDDGRRLYVTLRCSRTKLHREQALRSQMPEETRTDASSSLLEEEEKVCLPDARSVSSAEIRQPGGCHRHSQADCDASWLIFQISASTRDSCVRRHANTNHASRLTRYSPLPAGDGNHMLMPLWRSIALPHPGVIHIKHLPLRRLKIGMGPWQRFSISC